MYRLIYITISVENSHSIRPYKSDFVKILERFSDSMLPSNSNPKRQNISEVDIISNLPDSVLYHILSFVPTTKQVAATSILSKRWRYLWTFVDKLVFNYRSNATFVYRVVLKLHQGNIKELELCCDSSQFDVTSWINTAISRGVEKLDVNTISSYTLYNYKCPLSIFTCNTLVDLKFPSIDITNLDVPIEPLFPCLKKLHLPLLSCDCFVRFIQLLSNEKVLRLKYQLKKFLNSVGHCQFLNLTKLEIVSQYFEWRLLVCFMEKSINLEAITLKRRLL